MLVIYLCLQKISKHVSEILNRVIHLFRGSCFSPIHNHQDWKKKILFVRIFRSPHCFVSIFSILNYFSSFRPVLYVCAGWFSRCFQDMSENGRLLSWIVKNKILMTPRWGILRLQNAYLQLSHSCRNQK